MAQFEKSVKIDVNVDIDEELSGLQSLNESIQEVRSSVENFDESVQSFGETLDESLTDSTIEKFKALSEAKDSVTTSNEALLDSAAESSEGLTREAMSFEEAAQSAESLSNLKNAVTESNEALSDANEETIRTTLQESDALQTLSRQAAEAKDSNTSMLDVLDDMEAIQERVIEANIEQAKSLGRISESSETSREKLSALREGVDEVSDSMKAAANVGELFEDGLGSLSVNLGAFTVAVRNFLTQVPLILTGLSAIGGAAAGAASSIVAVGGALTTAFGAGALALAEQVKQEHKEIKQTGEALQVVFAGVKDTMRQAIAPLVENAEVIEIFRDGVVGLSQALGLIAQSVNQLTSQTDTLEGGVLSISGVLSALGSRLEDDFIDVLTQLQRAFILLQDEFIFGAEALVSGIADIIRAGTTLFNKIEDLAPAVSELGKTLRETAEAGMNIASGLLPILRSFLGLIREAAKAINSFDDQAVTAAVGVIAFAAALNKLGGAIGGVLTIIPNVIVGMQNLAASAASANTMFGSMILTAKGAAVSIASFLSQSGNLSGLRDLSDGLDTAIDELRALQLQSLLSEETLESFGEEGEETIETALILSQVIDKSEDSVEELSEELNIAEERLEAFTNSSITSAVTMDFLGEQTEDAADELQQFAMSGVVASLANSSIAGTSVLASVAMTGLSVAGQIANASLMSLAATATVLTGGLALLLFAVGALAVGVITNFEQIKAAVTDAAGGIMRVLKAVGNFLLVGFVETWNTLVQVFQAVLVILQPILNAFGLLKGSAKESTGFIEGLVASINFLTGVMKGLFDVVRIVVNVIAGIGTIITVVISAVLNLAKVLFFIFNPFALFIKTLFDTFDIMSKLSDLAVQTGKVFNALGKELEHIGNTIRQEITKQLNRAIEVVNALLAKVEQITGIEMSEIEKIDLSGSDDLKATEKKTVEQTNEAINSLTAKQKPQVTLNEDNSQNIEQTVNADPEQKATLSRVVKDAIEEANAFDRRQQGGQ